MDTWRSGISMVADCPNVSVKLGGIGMPRTGFDWHERDVPIGSEELADSMAPFMNYCIEQFGPGPRHVREQLPGGQGRVLVQRDVQRLQAPVQRLHRLGARGDVPRHGAAFTVSMSDASKPESTEGRPWGQPLKKAAGAPLNLG